MESCNAVVVIGHLHLAHASLGVRWNVGDLRQHLAVPGIAGGILLQMFPNVCVCVCVQCSMASFQQKTRLGALGLERQT